MKWFKRLLHEKSANHCSPVPKTICAVMIANPCIYSDTRASNANGSTNHHNNNNNNEDNDEILSSAVLRNDQDRIMIPKRIIGNLALGGRRSKRHWNTAPYRSATRLMAKLEGNILDEKIMSPIEVMPIKYMPNQQLVDPDDFFEDPDEVRLYCAEKKWLAEWCIVDAKVHIGFGSDEEDDDPDGLYATTVFGGETTPELDSDDTNLVDDIEDTFVTVQRTPSVISLTSYKDDTFGIFYGTRHGCWTMPTVPEAHYYYSMECDIQSGLAMDPAVSAFEEIMVETFNLNTNEVIQKPKAVTASIPKDSREIARMFCLSEYGSICLNMDHILEERGYGFLMRRSKRLYRNVEWGQIASERRKHATFLGTILAAIMSCFRVGNDHPRNKPPTIGNAVHHHHHNDSTAAGSSIADYAHALANDSSSTFARNIQNFITCTKEAREITPQVMMRNMRQFMSGMKNYLVKHGEGDFQNEVQRARGRLRPDEFLNLDQILEGVMHRLVVLPLKKHLYSLFVDHYTQTGQIQLLVDNIQFAALKGPLDFGIPPNVTPPSSAAMQHIALLITRLQEAELPLDKLSYLLAVVSAIFETATPSRDEALGADLFLPLLVYVLAKCEFIGAQIESEFMFDLLHQSLLTGEAGYYLTSLSCAVQVLKGLMGMATNGDSNQTEVLDNRSNTLQPPCSSVLRVIIPDEFNGSLQTRTLPVRPNTTTKEVCRTIAHKARITNPQDYALFELVDGEETLLTDNDCPQESRLAALGKHCMFAYKRIDAKIAWPTMSTT